ncbi:MAG TPA: iron ABC transporter permease [Chloroflexota bacterium]|nr:iron ABC transporter permease [Chloroflexota bacterium]
MATARSIPLPLAAPRGAGLASRAWQLIGQAGPLVVGLILAGPLAMLVINSFNVAAAGQPARFGLDNWAAAVADPSAVGALVNSLELSLTRTAISLPVALGLSWLITRTDMPGRSIVELFCWLSIFIPILPLTFGWVLLLDPRFGLVNAALGASLFNIYSFWGITWVHLASNSIAFKVILMVPAFRRIGADIEEAARMSGADPWQTLRRITLPLLTPAILLVTVVSLVLSFESFEVELLLGKPVRFFVYTTRIYDLVNNQPSQVGEATALSFVFVVWLVALTAGYRRLIGGRSFTTVTGKGYAIRPVALKGWRWVAAVGCFLYFGVALLAPFSFLLLGSFMRLYGFFNVPNPYTLAHWQALFAEPAFFSGVRNSLIIAGSAAAVAIAIYSLIAYVLVRYRTLPARLTDALVWAPYATPGVLMSLGVLWLLLSTPLRTALYGTVAGIALAFVLRAAPISTQFFRTQLLQIGAELEESARMSGASWLHTYWKVLMPLLAPAAVTVGLLTFLAAVYDISTPVLLYSAGSRPLSILMLEYSFASLRERGAAIGVLITTFVLLVLIVARSFGYRLSRDRL